MIGFAICISGRSVAETVRPTAVRLHIRLAYRIHLKNRQAHLCFVIKLFHMKKISIFRWLVAAALAASLSVEARAAANHTIDFDFVAFGFPWWYPYPYPDWSPYDYAYYDYAPSYDYQYWARLAVAVQSELIRRGYYHGPVDGVIGSDSRQAIRAFQAAQGLPVTGMIDPRLLKSLGISYRHA